MSRSEGEKQKEKLVKMEQDAAAQEGENCWLYFDNGKKLHLKAIGLHGLFRGYLTFVRGDFEFVDLQNINYISSRIFALDDDICINVGESTETVEKKDDKKKKKYKKNEIANNDADNPIAILSSCIPEDWNEEKHAKYITLITNFRPEILSLSLDNDKDFFKYQNVRCVLYFPNSDEQIDADEKKIHKLLNEMPKTIDEVNVFAKPEFEKPFYLNCKAKNAVKTIDKLDLFSSKKNVLVMDFGISEGLKEILQTYWKIVIVPMNEHAKRIKYLTIDGVIISDSVCNTRFVNADIKQELKTLLEGKIPVMGIGFGGILLSELVGIPTEENKDQFVEIGSYQIYDESKKIFTVDKTCRKNIECLPMQSEMKKIYYNRDNKIEGFIRKKLMCCCFDLMENTIDTARILNEFELIMRKR
ncbi:MAG: hypothetical protein IJ590_00785 [Rickettsiales bacterium]|nr:hypothetical protein [Rickettsiales bacterium]